MPNARPVLPDTSFTTCRRATRRYFVFRPDPDGKMQETFVYLLAVIAKQEGMVVHAVVCLSSHFHVVLTDTRGRLPVFFQRFHRALAMCTKCLRGWDAEVFNKSQTSRVELETVEAWIEQLGYVIANPVEAGMVRRVTRYPGVVTLPSEIGTKTFRVSRPDIAWLVDEDLWPEEAELRIEMPQVLLDEYGLEGAQEVIANEVARREREARAERAKLGLGFHGPKACMRAPITTQSTKKEELHSRNPTFAVGRGQRSAFFAAVERLCAWRESYDGCLDRWRAGDRDVVWPAGTWLMVQLHGATAEDPPLE